MMEVLSEGPLTTRQVMSALLERWPKMSVTPESVSQTLARYPEFTAVGETTLLDQHDHGYKTKVWGLSDNSD